MRISLRAGSILTAVAVSIAGCDPDEPNAEGPPKLEEPSGSRLGPPSPVPPIMPSPKPSLPEPSQAGMKPEAKKDEPNPEPKPDEPKPAEKKDEPKLEPPK